MSLTSTAEAPSVYGFLPSDAESFAGNIVLSMPLEESQTIVKGDFLVVSTAGYWQKNTTKEAKVKGIAMSNVTSTATQLYGEAKCSVLVWGIAKVDALVQDTDGAAGYDADIDVGQALFVGGDAGALVADGQGAVAGDGTDGVTTNQFGIALDACDGSTTADKLYAIRVFFDGLSNIV